MRFQSQLARNHFEKYVLEVAITTLEMGGSVSNLDTYQLSPPVDDWKFPKYTGKTAILPPEIELTHELQSFILANEPILRESECWLGTWINPNTAHFYFDIVTSHPNFEEARKMTLEISDKAGRKIVALYNSARHETCYL